MKYNYLDYLAENEYLYRKLLPISIMLVLMFTILSIIGFKSLQDNQLSSYITLEGKVDDIKMSTAKRYKDLPFGSSVLDDVEAVIIVVNGRKFEFDSSFKPYWDAILNDVDVGDKVKVYFKPIKDNYSHVVQIEKGSEIILPFSYNYGFGIYLVSVISILSLLLIYWNLVVHFKRKRLKNR